MQELGFASWELDFTSQELGFTLQELSFTKQELGLPKQESGFTKQEIDFIREKYVLQCKNMVWKKLFRLLTFEKAPTLPIVIGISRDCSGILPETGR